MAFTGRYEGRVWCFGANISTDLMMPGASVLARPGITGKEAAKYCMEANRPGWAMQVQPGDIVVAGSNFGCGSSRPAPRMFLWLGIAVVVADSMSRLFFRNAVSEGLPTLSCPGVSAIFEEGDTARIDIVAGLVTNITRNRSAQGQPLQHDSPPMQILRAGGLDAFWDTQSRQR